MSCTWREIADYMELVLAKRTKKNHESCSYRVKEHAPMEVVDHVMIQNQVCNQPTRGDKQGMVMHHRQNKVMVDGSRRITLRNSSRLIGTQHTS